MKKIGLALFCLLTAELLWANGDPVASFSAMTLSRTPVAIHVPEVQLMQESLEITPMGTYTHVHVAYLLRNTSSKHFSNLNYGFPIDYIGSGSTCWGEGNNPFGESVGEIGWRDSYIRNVAFTLNNNMLPWQCSADTMLSAPKPILTKEEEKADSIGELWENRVSQLLFEKGDATIYRQHIYGVYRRWFYTTLNITPNQTVTLEVDYQVFNSTSTDLYRLGSEFCQQWPAGYEFHYDFSPASYWGNGKAETFEVNLHTDHVIKKDKETWREFDAKNCIFGLKMKKVNENLYTYSTRNFDLAKAEPLQINFLCPTSMAHQPVADILSHRIPPSQYTVKVSDCDSKYPAANLSDLDLSTTTVLKPDPRGENYITITFKDSMCVTGIVFYNGYCKDRNSYINNSRARTMMVTVTDREFNGVNIHYPFANYTQTSYTPDTLPTAIPSTFTWQGLTDQALLIPMANNLVKFEDGRMFSFGYYDYEAVKQITFSIPTTIPGQKYNDLCISEIIVLGGPKRNNPTY